MIIPAARAAAGWWAATWATPTAGCGTAARRRRAPGGPRCCPRAGRCGPGSRAARSAGSRTPWPWSPSEVGCRHDSDGWLGFEYNSIVYCITILLESFITLECKQVHFVWLLWSSPTRLPTGTWPNFTWRQLTYLNTGMAKNIIKHCLIKCLVNAKSITSLFSYCLQVQ